VLEEDSLARESIHVGRFRSLAAVAAECVGAQRVDDEDEKVGSRLRCGLAADEPGEEGRTREESAGGPAL
jgi:hypothetical protein